MSSIGPVVSEEKMFENVDGQRTDDGRRSHWYTISSPMSLRLRWAKKKEKYILCLSGGIGTSFLQSQHFNTCLIFQFITYWYSLLDYIVHFVSQPSCLSYSYAILFSNTLKQLFSGLIQKNFHGLSYTIVRIFSGQCVFLNLVLPQATSLKLQMPENENSNFWIFCCVIRSSFTKKKT